MQEDDCNIIKGGSEITFEIKSSLMIKTKLIMTPLNFLWFFCHWPEVLLFGKKISTYNDWKIWTTWRFKTSESEYIWNTYQNNLKHFIDYCISKDLYPLMIIENSIISLSFALSLGSCLDLKSICSNLIILSNSLNTTK